ncbi:hypothetical protein ACFYXL_18350 [Streptomyces tsukubensis]|uniref:hypothetical protein n=1 Tax=Streptomyces tsukubensis TaxID=83656 RepID=UPI0036CA92D1
MKGKPPSARRIRHGVQVTYKTKYRYTFKGVIVGAVYSGNPMKKDHITAVVVRQQDYGLPRHTFIEECSVMEVIPIENIRIRRS